MKTMVDPRMEQYLASPEVKAWLSPSAVILHNGQIVALQWPQLALGKINRDTLDDDHPMSWAALKKTAESFHPVTPQKVIYASIQTNHCIQTAC